MGEILYSPEFLVLANILEEQPTSDLEIGKSFLLTACMFRILDRYVALYKGQIQAKFSTSDPV